GEPVKRARTLLGAALVLAVWHVASPARADDGDSAPPAAARVRRSGDDAASRARKSFRAGVAASDKGDWETARARFVAAYALAPIVDVLWYLAVAERRSGHPVEALAHYRAYAASRGNKRDLAALATEQVSDLEAEVGHLRFDAPDNAEISVDGA